MEIISRKQAKEQGLTRYFTGKPCKRGHVCERSVTKRVCVECAREDCRNWYQANTKRERERVQQWRQENRERHREASKRWSQENADRKRETHRRWRKENPDIARASERRWKQENPIKVKTFKATRRAKNNNASGKYTKNDIDKMLSLQRFKCAWCRTRLKSGYHVDHIVPLSNGGSNYPDNLQLLCPSCNCSKNAKDPIEWAQENGRLL